jgi:hypothetical protein
MTIRGQDFDEAAAYVRTTRTLERLCRDYGFEYVLGVFSNGSPNMSACGRRRSGNERRRGCGAGRQGYAFGGSLEEAMERESR